MIRTLLTTFFCLTASLAQAESFNLHSSGAWDVDYVTFNNSVWCQAQTRNPHGEKFDITAFPDGEVVLYLFLGEDDYVSQNRIINFILDFGQSTWNMRDAVFERDMVKFTLSTAQMNLGKFIGDIRYNRTVSLIGTTGDPLAVWSLRGSNRAIDALVDCMNKL